MTLNTQKRVSNTLTRFNTDNTTTIATNSSLKTMIGSRPTSLSVPPMRFLIMDAPRQTNLHLYIKEMKKHSVSDVVRVCEPTYQSGELDRAGMVLHEMEYPDGHAPSIDVIGNWLSLVEKTFYSSNVRVSSREESSGSSKCIAVHCVAGLGRAPVMVAIALIEFANFDPVEAVALIRKHRRGAINEKQLNYLEGYKRCYKRLDGKGSCCIIL
mmetsp:Transcript_38205/g.43609  ORF Transcript_38205/g.43609 Transcript_38205/m.43609 type:complete len:212 (+) Transcript_38205:306-941(+)